MIASAPTTTLRFAFAFGRKRSHSRALGNDTERHHANIQNRRMWCLQGDRELKKGARRGSKYCSDACRARAYRERQRAAMQPSGGDGLATEPAGRFRRVPARAARNADHRVAVKRGPAPQRASRRRWRVAFDEQVLAQAPDAAVGYRVVLPGRDEWDAPRVVPDADVMGSPSFWRLRPFELPDDIRLRSGKRYRLLWVDAQGARVPPMGCRSLPALRFFLGPPDEVRVVKCVGRSSGRAAAKKKHPALVRLARSLPLQGPRYSPSPALGRMLSLRGPLQMNSAARMHPRLPPTSMLQSPRLFPKRRISNWFSHRRCHATNRSAA